MFASSSAIRKELSVAVPSVKSNIVYRAVNKVNGHSYIGFTSQGLVKREWTHRDYARKGRGQLLQRAIRKHGNENFVFEVMADFGDDEELARCYEFEAIAKYQPEYNILPGGEGGAQPPEVRARISATLKGRKQRPETIAKRKASNAGFRHSQETKDKLAALWRGKPRSPETIAKMRAAMAGRPAPRPAGWKHTPETLAKMAALPPRPPVSAETRAKMSASGSRRNLTCLTDGRVFHSYAAADKFYGFPSGRTRRILHRHGGVGFGLVFREDNE